MPEPKSSAWGSAQPTISDPSASFSKPADLSLDDLQEEDGALKESKGRDVLENDVGKVVKSVLGPRGSGGGRLVPSPEKHTARSMTVFT